VRKRTEAWISFWLITTVAARKRSMMERTKGRICGEVSRTGTIGLRKFYGKRARRLLPVSALVGVVTAIASALLLPPLQAKSALMDGVASALYVPNFWFIGQQVDYFADNVLASPFQHYWTLGVEEQFYLVWPPMIVGTANETKSEPASTSKRTTALTSPTRAT